MKVVVSATTRPGKFVWTTDGVLFANGVTVGTDVLTAPSFGASPEFDVSDGSVALLALLDCCASLATDRLGVPPSVGDAVMLASILFITIVVGYDVSIIDCLF